MIFGPLGDLALGQADSGATISGVGNIASAESFGAPSIAPALQPSGIPSAESIGAASVQLVVSPISIASAEAFGAPALSYSIQTASVPSAEQFGAASLVVIVSPNSIPSAETFGTSIFVGGDYARTTIAYSANIIRDEEQQLNETFIRHDMAALIDFDHSQPNVLALIYSSNIVQSDLSQRRYIEADYSVIPNIETAAVRVAEVRYNTHVNIGTDSSTNLVDVEYSVVAKIPEEVF